MKTRTGKIARLPLDVRTELNRRIENGEPGNELVEWLNDQREVECVLDAYFGGRAINAQNFADWKAGGYQDWLAQRALQAEARQLTENAGMLAASARVLPEHLVTVLAIRYAALLAEWNGEATDEFERQLRSLDRLRQSVVALQRGHHQAIEADLKQRRYEDEWKEADWKRRSKAETNEAIKETMIWSQHKYNKEHPDDPRHYSFLEPDEPVRVECRLASAEGGGEEAASIKAGKSSHAETGEEKVQPSRDERGGAENAELRGVVELNRQPPRPREGGRSVGDEVQRGIANDECGGEGAPSIKANQGESSHGEKRMKDEGKSMKRGKRQVQHSGSALPLTLNNEPLEDA